MYIPQFTRTCAFKFILVLGFWVQGPLRAQQNLIYQEAILASSPLVESQKYQIDQELARKRQTLLAFAPKVSLRGTVQKRSAICLFPKHGLDVSVDQVVFDPAHTIIPYHKEKYLVQAAQAGFDSTLYEINERALGYDIALETEKKNQLSTQILQSAAHTQYHYDQALYHAGLIIEPIVLASAAKAYESDTTYQNTLLKQTADLVSFQSTIGESDIVPDGYNRETRADMFDTFLSAYNPNKLVEKAVSHNPAMRKFWFSMQAALEDASAAGWSYLPRFNLFFGYDTQRYSSICNTLPESLPRANWQAGLRAEWDFDGLSRIEDRSIALFEYCKLASERRATIKDYEQQATELHTSITHISSAIADAKKARDAAQAAYNERRAQYEVGLATIVEVEKARADLAGVQTQLDELLREGSTSYEAVQRLSGYSLA